MASIIAKLETNVHLSNLFRSIEAELNLVPVGPHDARGEKVAKDTVSPEVAVFWDIEQGGPSAWGRVNWAALYHKINGLPDVLEAKELSDVIVALMFEARMLPCKKCSQHFLQHIKRIDVSKPEAHTRAYILKWLSDVEHSIPPGATVPPAAKRAAMLRHRMKQVIPKVGESASDASSSWTWAGAGGDVQGTAEKKTVDRRLMVVVGTLAAMLVVALGVIVFLIQSNGHKRRRVPQDTESKVVPSGDRDQSGE